MRQRRRNFRSLYWQLPLLGLAGLAALSFAFRSDNVGQRSDAQATLATLRQPHHSNPNKRQLANGFISVFSYKAPLNEWDVSEFTWDDVGIQNSWKGENVVRTPAGAELRLSHATSGRKPFAGAELQSRQWVQYGRVEVLMKPIPGSGAVTSFSTWTSPFYRDPNDQIDMEWVGVRPELIQLDVRRNGNDQGAWKHALDFEVAEDYHLYAFEWTPDSIVWTVDGQEIHRVSEEYVDIPDTPQKLVARVWTGSNYQWHGQPNFNSGDAAIIKCVSYQPMGVPQAPSCSDRPDLLLLDDEVTGTSS